MEEEEKGTVENPEVALEGAEVADNLDNPNAGVEFTPLFDTETVTEAELMGEDVAEEEAVGSEPIDDDPEKDAEAGEEIDEEKADREKKEAEAKAKADEEKEPEKEAEAKKDEEGKDTKPSEEVIKKNEQIEGLTIAVRQERDTVSKLKQENQRLSAELENAKAPEADDKEAEQFKDFKPLSMEDYDQLLDEDPDEASRYLYKYNQWRDYQDTVNKRQLSEHQAQAAEREIINYGIQALEEVLPGITQGKNEMSSKLTEFAVENGVDAGVLQVLTDPRTKVTTAGGESLLIGDGAAQLVKLVKSTFEKVSNVPDEAKLREAIEAELRPKIEAEIQDEVIRKLQQDPSGGSFRSLDNVTGSGKKDSKPITGIISEAEYARMDENEQRAVLGE